MLIFSSRYTAPIEQMDALRPAHLEWLKTGHAAGHFIAWGRKADASGGVIMGQGDRATVEAFAQTDPYVLAGVVEIDVIEFAPAFAAAGLETLLG